MFAFADYGFSHRIHNTQRGAKSHNGYIDGIHDFAGGGRNYAKCRNLLETTPEPQCRVQHAARTGISTSRYEVTEYTMTLAGRSYGLRAPADGSRRFWAVLENSQMLEGMPWLRNRRGRIEGDTRRKKRLLKQTCLRSFGYATISPNIVKLHLYREADMKAWRTGFTDPGPRDSYHKVQSDNDANYKKKGILAQNRKPIN
ncbi:uncharacterized protein LOC107270516 [Cephus cinctus]|uniref:Uncharacterized protein LOC107270516 n=1 Tax=Cephus cinctus TaxID=211228 RepID=A0AAJ7RMI0_CEPCN|nr:uncharacterized protein LOC107270516 [Cephus cinctus]